jgi:hypothetical protein
MSNLIKTIDSISFQNSSNEYLDITYHIEGYVDINLETSGTFSFQNESEVDEFCNAIKELLRQKKSQKRKYAK